MIIPKIIHQPWLERMTPEMAKVPEQEDFTINIFIFKANLSHLDLVISIKMTPFCTSLFFLNFSNMIGFTVAIWERVKPGFLKESSQRVVRDQFEYF